MEKQFSVRYRVNCRRVHDPLLGKLTAYGISGFDHAGGHWRLGKVFGDRVFAARIAVLLNRNQVSLLHADDVVSDLLSGGTLFP